MMRISGTNMNNVADGIRNGMQSSAMQRNTTQMGLSQKTDSISQNIQNQIQNKQQELQKLSENKDMSLEDKMKKRQEIQQQISELNSQLRQHQIQQRREQQQSKGNVVDDMLGEKSGRFKSKGRHGAGLSQTSMKAMISADASMHQAQTQESIATQLEGRAGVLEAEIKQDGSRGVSTEKKEAELADTLVKASDATASQMHALHDANEAVKDAQAAESENNKAEGTRETSKKKADDNQKEAAKASGKKTEGAQGEPAKAVDSEQETDTQNNTANMPDNTVQAADTAALQTERSSISLLRYYTPIDVYL